MPKRDPRDKFGLSVSYTHIRLLYSSTPDIMLGQKFLTLALLLVLSIQHMVLMAQNVLEHGSRIVYLL